MLKQIFPIKVEPACLLKWSWSTVYFNSGTTASCHRTEKYAIDPNNFNNFHNVPEKIRDRTAMLNGQWPGHGCEYCRNIESADGASDRITNLDLWDFDQPKELQVAPTSTTVTPRILEIYFNNTCNLKCTYCGPWFSSLWNDELRRYGESTFELDKNFESNKNKLFNWLKDNISELHQLNVLGGEPLYQKEFDQLLDILEQTPAPNLTLTFFSNLAVSHEKLVDKIDRIERLINQGYIKKLLVTASLDCWGPEQEYARFPLDLHTWEKNFNYLLNKSWITLVVSSTITPLTIKTLSTLFEKINSWGQTRDIYWYGNSVNAPDYLFIDMFGPVFEQDFNRAIALMPTKFPEQNNVKKYLEGIRDQSKSNIADLTKIENLYIFLNKLDKRRGTDWRNIYPWLVLLFKQHIGKE
jgi:hypothetical protein